MGAFGNLVKLGLSAVLIIFFLIPEPASSAFGISGLFAIWGIDWSGGGAAE